ncbi:hypothetical protein [Ramlibacter tataouinensis]|uniref:Membrane protein n=1 Tax=Ramlibacter tataouinensis TaxID=94132 RepID=A0A127JZB0_9BURK|nr:hypothetical protein [Ramlibacter tataouinensis]AMO25269.1 membrane protein [Ramlibacter tataouinensis]
MSGPTAIRLAALLALGYALWVLIGGPIQLGAGGNVLTVRVSASHAISWLVGLLSLVLAIGLWSRFAWAWWLALVAALVQGWRVLSAQLAHQPVRMPGAVTLIVLALLLVFLVLLFMPKARATCNR